jgi:hypothetical protein
MYVFAPEPDAVYGLLSALPLFVALTVIGRVYTIVASTVVGGIGCASASSFGALVHTDWCQLVVPVVVIVIVLVTTGHSESECFGYCSSRCGCLAMLCSLVFRTAQTTVLAWAL